MKTLLSYLVMLLVFVAVLHFALWLSSDGVKVRGASRLDSVIQVDGQVTPVADSAGGTISFSYHWTDGSGRHEGLYTDAKIDAQGNYSFVLDFDPSVSFVMVTASSVHEADGSLMMVTTAGTGSCDGDENIVMSGTVISDN